ncbi:cardiolipin synthase [Panacagrimonas perspica]|uniref:Cardiolipin synthase n=1 Tax=Panacagrimonas perspica TaxID=381431 RepID=A0A4R7P0Q7_9GAMM|nr:phospholipase D-like domain-containing protein [Panacagrimonas perspica]TDU26799.1 cardiolipin synthase [Panacagrimonas perspica]
MSSGDRALASPVDPRGASAGATRSRVRLPAVVCLALLGIQACATLPDARRDRDQPHAKQVEFEGARGPVSEIRSDAIIKKLEGSHGESDVLATHLAYEQAVNAASPLVLGNRLTLLQNGPDTYQAMYAAIREAKDHINLETFIFDDGEAGKVFSELLLERQAAGVQVNLIRDSVGSLSTPAAFFERLRQAGVRVLEFNPVNPLAGNKSEWALNNRDHRKLLVIDGRIAFTGGINISDTYSSGPSRSGKRRLRDGAPALPLGWRDTHIRIEGPAVAEFQKLFLDTWKRQQGDPLPERAYFPDLKPQGDEIVRAIGSTPDDPQSLIYLTLLSAITHAERSVHLTIAYFAPDPQLLEALTDAAGRGVEVRLVLPSHSDSWAIFHLGRSYYSRLLKGGVTIHERRGAVMHAKTACIDGVWSTIGSTNLDWRSFLHNDEINAVILGRGFAAQMDAMFAVDLAESDAIELSEWRHRSWLLRLQERTARIGAYWL